LPAEPISSGETGMAQLPPLSFEVDMTNSSLVSVTAFNFDMSFNLGRSGAVVSFDGQTLNGKKTKVDLGSQKSHDLVIDCNTAK
jgi:hypothetical protein